MSPHIGNFPREYPKPLSVSGAAFVPKQDDQDWVIEGAKLRNRSLILSKYFWAPVYLPNGVTVTKLTLYGYRTTTGSTLRLQLMRCDREGSDFSMADVSAAWVTDWSSVYDDTINGGAIDNENYQYGLQLQVNPDADVFDCMFGAAIIDWN